MEHSLSGRVYISKDIILHMYVLQRQQQIERTREMVTLRKDDQTLEVFYHDPKTGEMWKSFFPKRANGTSGPKLLRPEPLPEDLEEQLNACLLQGSQTDAQGLGTEYSMKPEKWAQILDLLYTNRKSYPRKNFFTFLKYLEILNVSELLRASEANETQLEVSESTLFNLQKQAKKLKLKKILFL